MTGFEQRFRAAGDAAMERVNEIAKRAILEAGQRMIDRSPIDTGRFKSNWNFGLQTPDRHTTEQTNVRTVNNLEELPDSVLGFTCYVTNSLPYAHGLEFGHSKQAPNGFARLTGEEWPQIVAAAAKAVKP